MINCRRSFVSITISLLLFTSTLFGFAAQAESPSQVLRNTQKKLDKLLSQKSTPGTSAEKKVKVEIKKLVNTLLDYNELAKLSLGKHWNARNEKERNEFISVFQDLIEQNYTKQLKSNLGYTVEYRPEKFEGDKATVPTIIKIKKNGRITDISIDYKLHKIKDTWKVFDVITDEVSIVVNYRSQFNRIIKKESFNALLNKMRNKLEKTS